VEQGRRWKWVCACAALMFWANPARAVDCNSNAFDDALDISGGTSADCNTNGVPDECDLVQIVQQAKLTASAPTAFAFYGIAVAVSDDTAVVGTTGDDEACGGGVMCNAGSVYVYVRDGASWSEQAKINAGDGASADNFGRAVALDGNTLAVGATGDDDLGAQSGSVYVYVRSGTSWSQQAKLNASDGAAGDSLGLSVALDGDTLVVGAFADDGAGSAYVFTRTGTIWSEQDKLVAGDAAPGDDFGWSVALHADTAVIGARADNSPDVDAGSAYVFTRTGTVWTEQAKLTASDSAANDEFGWSVALHADTAVIGAYRDDDACPNCDSGSAYVFTRTGTTWNEQDKLTADDAASEDQFGYAVAVRGDTAVIGARLDDAPATDRGSGYVFKRSGGVWTQVLKVAGNDSAGGDTVGQAVAMGGNKFIISALGDDDGATIAGSAYVFDLAAPDCNSNGIPDECEASDCDGDGVLDECAISAGTSSDCNADGTPDNCQADCDGNGVPDDCDISGNTANDCDGNGVLDSCDLAGGSGSDCNANGTPDACDIAPAFQQFKITADTGELSDRFGRVAISGDTAVVGASLADDFGLSSGAAYIFLRSGDTWVQQAQLIPTDAEAQQNFGTSVDIDGDTAVVGAYRDDHAGAQAGSAYAFVRVGETWIQQAKLTADDAAFQDFFGISIALSGNTAVVGAPGSSMGPNTDGAAYVFERVGTVWSQQAKLTASDGAVDDDFGYSVAIDGDTAIVGSIFDDDEGSQTGSAYVYFRSGAVWTQQAKLLADDATSNDRFGESVAILGDTAMVGATLDDENMLFTSGSVYVFDRSGTVWTQTDKLNPADASENARFGRSIALDGDTAVIGAVDDAPAGTDSGSAYVFVRAAGIWTERSKLIPDFGDPNDFFGESVGVSGTLAIIGSPLDDDLGDQAGAAYVYDLQESLDCNSNAIPDACDLAAATSVDCNGNAVPDECETDCNANGIPDDCDIAAGTSPDCNGEGIPDECGFIPGTFFDCNSNAVPDVCDISGGTSSDCNTNGLPDGCELFAALQQAKLTASDASVSDALGSAVAIEGDTAVVGAENENFGPLSNSGAAYVFVRVDDQWVEQAKLLAPAPLNDDRFGHSVAISGDTIVVGAYGDDNVGPSSSSGSAFVFTRSGDTWSLQAQLTASDAASGDQFGWSVAIEGDTALVGAITDDAPLFNSGSVYVYTRSGSVWTEQTQLTAGDADTSDAFGFSVDLEGDTAAIGAYFENSTRGAVYVFTGSGATWTEQDKLVPTDSALSQQFGSSVILSGDRLIAGAPGDAEIATNAGAAYIFERTGGAWSQTEKLLDPTGAANDFFGLSVALENDVAVVGVARDDDACPGCDSGSVRVFEHDGVLWDEAPKLLAADADQSDILGIAVALSGKLVIASAVGDDEAELSAGAAYVFALPAHDCDSNAVLDVCDIASGSAGDCNLDGVPDGCEPDCNTNGAPDECDIAEAVSLDCNSNGVPDECDLADGTSADCSLDGIPDECTVAPFDLAAYAAFTICYGGATPECLDAFDVAEPCGVIDLADYAVLLSTITGP
jgi:hypothetical protein